MNDFIIKMIMISKLFLFLIVSAMTLKDPIMNLDLTLTIKH